MAGSSRSQLARFDALLKSFADEQFGAGKTSFADSDLLAFEKLLHSFSSEPIAFDCFDVGGWTPNENALSDVLAALLDPKRPHGLGPTFAQELLKKAGRDGSGDVGAALGVARLMSKPDLTYTVTRERAGLDSRADIEILGRDFLVTIEHKVYGGFETHNGRSWQTDRLYDDARRVAARHKIPEEHIACLLLSPAGGTAQHQKFVGLSFGQVAEVLRRAAATMGCRFPDTIRGFAHYYEGRA